MAKGIGRVLVLWGAHRSAPSQTGRDPTSIDKGVPELVDLGHELVTIYPKRIYEGLPAWMRKILRGRGRYFISSLYLLWTVRKDDVLYTTDNDWAGTIARFKKLDLMRNHMVFKWAGFDLDWSKLSAGGLEKDRQKFANIGRRSDNIFAISAHELELIAANFGLSEKKIAFWPTAVDVDFYRKIAADYQGDDSGIVAVGSDRMRDWPIVIDIARRGIPITIVTEDPKAKALVDALGDDRPPTLHLAYKVGMRRSAEIMAGASALIISTLPNDRFSGATTVGVAASLGKPLILDEPHDLAAYGLIPGRNCEKFERGVLDSAIGAIQRVRADPAHARHLAQEIGLIADSLDIRHYAAALSSAFRLGYVEKPFTPGAIGIPALLS